MKVGPISALNGFPVWYKDTNGLRLGLNVNPNDPYSGITIADLPNPSLPVSFPSNFPSEAFYQAAEAEMTTGTGERARLVLALEAAFVTEVPTDGDQIVFGRVRVRVEGLVPDAEYTVTHPYGTDTFIAERDDPDDQFAEINFTEDIGGCNGGEFELALNSRVHPFLQWNPQVPPEAPEGYVGDPNILHPIIGSILIDPTGQPQNIFRIEGPGIGIGSPDRATTPGFNPDNTIETREFSLLGTISTISGVEVTRATYSQTTATGGVIDVFAWTDEDLPQTIEVSGTGIDPTILQGINGKYIARVAYIGSTPPSTITVTNVSDNSAESIKEVVPVDFITATAIYDTTTQTLTIEAESSDEVSTRTLTILDFGNGEVIIPPEGTYTTTSPFSPDQVTILSDVGGERTIPVTVTGNPDTPIPVTADAGTDQTVLFDATVTLNGANSTGPITSFNWAQIAGDSVVISDASSVTPTFTAPSSIQTLSFELTVDGDGGPSTDTVNINVIESASAPIVNAGPNQVVQQGTVVTLTGTVSGDVTSLQWEQLTGPTVQINNANTTTATFTFPSQPDPITFRLSASGPGGTSFDDTVISTVPDTLTVTRAQFRTDDLEWRISGNSSVVGPGNTITIYLGNVLGGTILAEIPVDALGGWEYRVEPSNVQPDATRSISIQSSSGGVLVNVPINIRQ
ncbi:PKD domain-containing protein [Litchfieldia alkalitelluris]|uniref:PKD domain-containing protein n=1 Tax=Litchfieldia alkalitelluris TaxID=304268 RepID=UPI000997215F|nr:IPT/TIG domain protein [Litchfieldia alkalitelluris]